MVVADHRTACRPPDTDAKEGGVIDKVIGSPADAVRDIVGECQYPVTGTGCVDLVVTDLAVVERGERGLMLRECAPGFSPGDIRQLTGAPLEVELWAEMTDTGRSRHLAWCAGFRPGRRAAA